MRLLNKTRQILSTFKSSNRRVKGNPQKAILIVINSAAILSLFTILLVFGSTVEYQFTNRIDLGNLGVAFNSFVVQLHVFTFFKMKKWAVPSKKPTVIGKAPPVVTNYKETEIFTRPIELDAAKATECLVSESSSVNPGVYKATVTK